MKGVWLSYLLPRSLVEPFEAVVREDGHKPAHAFRAAVAGFLKMTPQEQAAAMKAIEHLDTRLPSQGRRGKRDPAVGLAVQLKIKHPDRTIG
ncbi:MAG: hypothetical protein GX616_15370 [Planctomycetes bacterium]|nr:hypothetical protein [Planctomycetota bacterium]